MEWSMEGTGEFEDWVNGLSPSEQAVVVAHIELLRISGPQLGFPYTSKVWGSRHGHLRELRIQHGGHPYRILYAFDPRRVGILLLGGDKTGDDRWYDRAIPRADRLYDEHLAELRKGGLS